jgi:hypothetical protein
MRVLTIAALMLATTTAEAGEWSSERKERAASGSLSCSVKSGKAFVIGVREANGEARVRLTAIDVDGDVTGPVYARVAGKRYGGDPFIVVTPEMLADMRRGGTLDLEWSLARRGIRETAVDLAGFAEKSACLDMMAGR